MVVSSVKDSSEDGYEKSIKKAMKIVSGASGKTFL